MTMKALRSVPLRQLVRRSASIMHSTRQLATLSMSPSDNSSVAAHSSIWASLLVLLFPSLRASAATLPEQRGDLLYHFYNGGGQTVQGPALLVRKNFAEKGSVSLGYYVDQISGASIDVVTNASPYHEERKEYTAGGDYLYRDTLMSMSYTNSNENDYTAKTWNFNVAQEMFDNRTTLSIGYYQGNDIVGKVSSNLAAPASRNGYSLSLSQVINPTVLANISYESTISDGYLQNPYRSARVEGAYVPEVDPSTRSGQAVSLSIAKAWTKHWSTRVEARYYTDSWQIHAMNIGFVSSQYIHRNWVLDSSYRFYTQKAASFYSDNFPALMDYMSRDKELASYTDHSLGTKLMIPLYAGDPSRHSVINTVNVNFAFNYLFINYKDFTDVRNGQLYNLTASVGQIYFTVRY